MSLHNDQSAENIHLNSSMTPSIALPFASTGLRSLILKKHLSTLYTQMTNDKQADQNLTRMILLNIFQRFQINKINFLQYLHLHNHPDTSDTFVPKCNAMTQTKTIRPKPFPRNLSNRLCTPLELQNLISYWPSDDNGYSDDELQKGTPEAILNQNSPYKTYTHVEF